MAASTLAGMVSQYAWGVASDVIGRAPVAFIGFALQAVFFLALPYMGNSLHAIGLRALEGIASAAVYTSIPAAVSGQAATLGLSVGLATGIARMMGSIGFAVAAIATSAILGERTLVFAFSAVLSVFSLPLAVFLKDKESQPTRRESLNVKRFSHFLVILVLWSFSFMAVTSVWPNYVASLGYNLGDAYVLWAVAAFGEVPFMVISGRLVDRGLMKETVVFSSLTLMLTYMIYVATSSWNYLIVAQITRAIAYAFFEASTLAYVSRIAAASTRGALIGLRNTAMNVGWILGALIGGVIADRFGLKTTILANAVILIIPTIITLLYQTKCKEGYE
ncbi:MAG: MFS transporter [Thermofilaceae archaeon]